MKITWGNRNLLRAPDDGTGAGDLPADPPATPAAATPDTTPATPDATPATPAAPPDFSYLPEDVRSDPDKIREHYETLTAERDSLRDRQAGVPETPAGYEFALPEDLSYEGMGLPEDFSVDLRLDDPVYAPIYEQFGATLHKHGVPASAASDLLGLMAQYQAADYAQAYAARQQDFNALGPSGQQRVGEVARLIDSRLPADLATALKEVTVSSKAVMALERLLTPSGTFPQSNASSGIPEDATPMERMRAANARSMSNK
ncbi:hypothetical protein JANAI62_03750 [Jannaschia pagri]|uniref:Uncharacterized protein n=1 Tax=Jannaschia pagri TaxID=2829797 RepID=A0ABQ4NH66_9RHOB|nr:MULTISPECIES: hypothetical protein [unclassified Jannaschia]GIT90142.1 hypothetical protein JANAI61_06000 [Jannaschia sp. AI_61]GIT93752.1 hypothetical protein JANAI62_03750 [Jannaschia sp. AI_62]